MPLFINGTPVNKISGPVSMFILTPKKSDIFPNLPVYMLFGDIHDSDQNMCIDKSPETLDIYGTDFLGLLNTLVTPNNELIDFYIEGGDLHNEETSMPYIEKYPMKMLWNLYSECYKNIRSEKKIAQYPHETQCNKIPNIRFQSGDPRFFKYDKKYEKLLLQCNMQNFLQLFKVKEDLTQDKFIDNLLSFRGDCIEKLLNTTFSFQDVNDEIFSEEGPIYKQLKKFSPLQRDTMIDYIKRYCLYAEEIYNREAYNPIIVNIHTELINIIFNLQFNLHPEKVVKSLEYIKDNWEFVKQYRDFLIVYKYTIVPDIYTLCRSFKYLNSPDIPIMNLVYFGNNHTNNVVHFLTKITNLYDKVEIKSLQSYDYLDTHSRCVEIKNDIDLNEILSNARKIRNKILPPLKKPLPQQKICLCVKKTGERCVNKAKEGLDFCGLHSKKEVQRKPSPRKPSPRKPSPIRKPSPRKPSPIRKPSPRKPSPRKPKQEEKRCLCINKSSSKRCINKAKPELKFCGVHKNCKNLYKLG
jgi:hypothetical protein